MATESLIETITNDLAGGYKEIVPGTLQEAAQVMAARRADIPLRNLWVYTANLSLYRMSPQEPRSLEYGLSGGLTFHEIAGRDIDAFTRQIISQGFYTLPPEQQERLEALASDIVWARADDLHLTRETDQWSYFTIPTSDMQAKGLPPAQRRIAVKAYGSLESKTAPDQALPDYGESMDMLQKAQIPKTRVWLPTTDHMSAQIPEGKVIARASRLGGIADGSRLFANYRVVHSHLALRGVRIVAEGDVQKIRDVYALLQRPVVAQRAAEMLDPMAATAISAVLSHYLAQQKEKA